MGKRCVSPARRNRQTSTTPLLSQTRAGREGGIPPDERSFYLEIHRALSLLILPLRGIFLSILSMPGLRKLTQKSRLLAQRMVRIADGETSPHRDKRGGGRCESAGLAPQQNGACSFLLPLEHEETAFVCLPCLRQTRNPASHVGAPLPAGVLLSSGSGSGP